MTDWVKMAKEKAAREAPKALPRLDTDGSLIIPFSSDKKYHYWSGGQKVQVTYIETKGCAVCAKILKEEAI